MSASRNRVPKLVFDRRIADRWMGHQSSSTARHWTMIGLVIAASLLAVATIRINLQFEAARQANLALAKALAGTQASAAQGSRPAPTLRVAATAADLRDENNARRMLNLPWSDILDGLERQNSAEVALTVLEPDGALGRLNVQAEARNVDVLLSYARQLAADRAFGPLVLRQQATNEADPNRPVRLSFGVAIAAPSLQGTSP